MIGNIDISVLSQLMTSQMILQTLPTPVRIGEFVAHVVEDMPSVQNCAVCIYGLHAPFGNLHLDCSKSCLEPNSSSEQTVSNVCVPENSEQMILFPLAISHLRFGQIVIAASDLKKFEFHRPFISNFANFVTIILDNQRSKRLLVSANEELAKHKSILEDQVDARTRELTAANQQLLASEQQLKASNQQLLASEQQLKASNQQLLASEQQLKASNQQLIENEVERENLLKTLFAKNKELQSVVYIASHDLRSPLVNIQGFSTELKNDCNQIVEILKGIDPGDEIMRQILPLTEEKIPESLGFITNGVRKMKVLLEGLLHVSRVGTVDINIGSLNMNDIVDNVFRSMEFEIKEAEVEVAIDDLPVCEGDSDMINQLFSNLAGNALKYLDPKIKGKIHITGTVEGSHSIYCVEDNGIGIAAEHLPKVFELFHRLDPKDSVGGEGLGLTIVTRILDRLNGHIRVESEPGRGSRFFVSLPTG